MEWDIQEFDLDGLQLTTNRTPDLPSVSVRVVINAGSLDELPRHKRGTAHFFEHIPFEGTKNFAEKAQDEAMKLEASLGALTSMECTQFSINMPLANWKAGLGLIADVVQHALMDNKNITSEARTIVNEIREKPFRTPTFALMMRFNDHLYGDPRLYSGLGTKDSVLSMRQEDLIAFRDQFYVRQNCRVILSGNLEHGEMQHEIGQAFRSLSYGLPTVREPLVVKPGYGLYHVPDHTDVMNYVTFPLASAEWNLRNAVLVGIIQGYFQHISGPAMADMRGVNNLVYGLDADKNWSRAFGNLTIGCISGSAESEAYVQKILEHAEKLVAGNIDEGFFLTAMKLICNADEEFYKNTKYPNVDNIQFWYERDGKLIAPDELLALEKSLTCNDFVNYARRVMAENPSFFAYGNTEGVVSEQRFSELIRPLTAAASVPKDKSSSFKPL